MERKKPTKKTIAAYETNMNRLNTLSTIVNRMGLAKQMQNQSFGGDRNIYEALGYPLELTFNDYFSRYDRQDIAKAIIDRPIKATWSGNVEITESSKAIETPLEQAWKALYKDQRLKSMFTRVDKLTGLGRYGILLFGLSDVKKQEDWIKPIQGKLSLMYLKPLSESTAKVNKYVTDTTDKRYGLPYSYSIEISESEQGGTKTLKVHYSRVLHIVDDVLESEIEGTPRLKNVFNRLMDLEKLVGGSAEMFWKGARPGFQGKVDKDFSMTSDAQDDLKDQIDEYEHNLRRILVNEGVSYESLAQQVADPGDHVDIQLQMISATTGIPKRILVGSERGELSSKQDSSEWNGYVQNRREEYAETSIVRPFIDKCIELGLLPKVNEEGYTLTWPDLFAQSELEKAEVGKTRSAALKEYASNPMAEATIPPQAFLEYFLGMNQDQIDVIEEMKQTAILEEPIISPVEQAILDKEAAEAKLKIEDK